MPVSEDELIAKATGPRVTKEELEANISSYAVFNAYEVLNEKVPANEALKLLTLCVLTMKNGFTVVGESACAWPANYDEDIGQRLALENAKNKMWSLMGYHLKQTLYLSAPSGESEAPMPEAVAPSVSEANTTWDVRLKAERDELASRLERLEHFTTHHPDHFALSDRDQRLLYEQKVAMREYLTILNARIEEA